MNNVIIFTLVMALATGVTVATVDMDAAFDDSTIVGSISGRIDDTAFARNFNYQIDSISNMINFDEIFDYENLIQVVAASMHEQGIIPDIKGDIWSLKKSTNFISELPVK